MPSTLIVVVGQDGATDNRQVGVGSCKIAWKSLDDVQQALKGQPADGHRKVLAVQKDAMLIKVGIGRILEAPLLSRNIKTNNPVIASSWMIDTTIVAFIFHTELTLRIVTRLNQLSRRNLLWILFRLREIDGNLQFTIVRWYTISNILCDSLQFDVVILLTELLEIRNCLLW